MIPEKLRHISSTDTISKTVGLDQFTEAFEMLKQIKAQMEHTKSPNYENAFVTDYMRMRDEGVFTMPVISHQFHISRTYVAIRYSVEDFHRFCNLVLPSYGMEMKYVVNVTVVDFPILFVDKTTNMILTYLSNGGALSSRIMNEAVHLRLLFDGIDDQSLVSLLGISDKSSLVPYFLNPFSLVSMCNGRSNDPGSMLALCTGVYCLPLNNKHRILKTESGLKYAYLLMPRDFSYLPFAFTLHDFHLLD